MGEFEEMKLLSARQASVSRPSKITCAGMLWERDLSRKKARKEVAHWELWSYVRRKHKGVCSLGDVGKEGRCCGLGGQGIHYKLLGCH